jgi:hypothetical protein
MAFKARFTRTIDADTGIILGKPGSPIRYNEGLRVKFANAGLRDAWVAQMNASFGACVEAI